MGFSLYQIITAPTNTKQRLGAPKGSHLDSQSLGPDCGDWNAKSVTAQPTAVAWDGMWEGPGKLHIARCWGKAGLFWVLSFGNERLGADVRARLGHGFHLFFISVSVSRSSQNKLS